MLLRLRITLLFALLACVIFLGAAAPAHAQSSQAAAFTHPPPMGFAPGTGSALAPTPPAAQYDEQLGTTFTQNFVSLSYNVTALGQTDADGYGPGYLLNALSNRGYWYQVGVSYDWPQSVGFNPGFGFAYEVFNSVGNSVFPAGGGGGLLPFSGTVNSGDTVQLSLSLSGGQVTMSAKDYSTGATASQTYSAGGATQFDGSPSAASNSNGFFTGLMTEWYHAAPYYSDEAQVTFSNPRTAVSSAWLWIDEFDSGNQSWAGRFSSATSAPLSYKAAPNAMQSFSSHGATESGDAFQFQTGGAQTATTTITLLPASPPNALSSVNGFAVSYTLNGQSSTAYAQGGTLALTTDASSSVSISPVSTGSTQSERWVLDSQGTPVSVASGSSATFYYYDLLLQQVSYATSDSSALSGPILDYYTAPATASSQSSEAFAGLMLQPSPQSIWAAKGSQVMIVGQIPGQTGEQWSLPTSQWTIASAGQVPFPILYYHQFFVTLGYSVVGGGGASGGPAVTCPEFGTQTGVPLFSSNWVDSGSCSYSSMLPGSNANERWATQTPTVSVIQPGPISVTYAHQYSLSVGYTITGGSPGAPTLTGVAFGASLTQPLPPGTAAYWLDAGSTYAVSNPLSSSGSIERWSAGGVTTGVLQAQTALSYTFYHQFLMSAGFSVIGGASGTSAPGLTYTSFGGAASIQLTGAKQPFWADAGSAYSVPQTLTGSSLSERWFTQKDQGTVQSSSALSFVYNHQFLLTVTGGAISSQWFNSSSTAQLSVPGVFGRASGSGERVVSYSLDGVLTDVKPTAGAVAISVQMNGPHQLSIDSVQQYQLSLNPAAASAISSVTPPTISGDGYWYDQGTPVSLALSGVWNRSAGTGERLLSYSLNGASKGVSTTGLVDVLVGVPLSSTEKVSAVTTAQYRLVADTGSIAGGTPASIPGDAGWYDSGTPVTVSYYYSWNGASGTRQNALGYGVGATTTQLPRSGTGTFPVKVVMDSPKTITIDSVTQYSLVLSGGNDVVLSLASPTHDSFYDSGTNTTATTDYTWGLVNGDVRQSLVSYTFDSVRNNVTGNDSGTFTTPSIAFDKPHTLSFDAVTQDLVTLQFMDSTGANAIAPTLVQLQSGGTLITVIPSAGVWLANGTTFQIAQVQWEGADVKPSGQTVYSVDGPSSPTVMDRVYSGSIVLTDYLGLPISGAKVSVTLDNGTTITSTTNSEGGVPLRAIPIGNYTASVSYLGSSMTIKGDAASSATEHAKLFSSYPTFVLIALAVIMVITTAVVVTRGRHLRAAIPADTPAQHLTQLCRNCGATIGVGSLHCPECGAEQV